MSFILLTLIACWEKQADSAVDTSSASTEDTQSVQDTASDTAVDSGE